VIVQSAGEQLGRQQSATRDDCTGEVMELTEDCWRGIGEARGWLDLVRHLKAGGVANERARNSSQWEARI
jgi:hypothetical protein